MYQTNKLNVFLEIFRWMFSVQGKIRAFGFVEKNTFITILCKHTVHLIQYLDAHFNYKYIFPLLHNILLGLKKYMCFR